MTSRMGWGGSVRYPADSSAMVRSFSKGKVQVLLEWDDPNTVVSYFSVQANRDKLRAGDLVFRDKHLAGTSTGHVGFFVSWANNGNSFYVLDAASEHANPQVGQRLYRRSSLGTMFTHIVRPIPLGSQSYASATTNSSFVGTAP